MSERPASQPQAGSSPAYDRTVARMREYIAGVLAAVIVVGAVAMMIIAVTQVTSAASDISFGRIKDLLLFINPLLGVVVGYYFNKASTEARAESAEQTAATVTNLAQQATASNERAHATAAEAQQAVAEHKQALTEVSMLSQQMLDITPPDPNVLSGPDEASDDGVRLRLQQAIERAQRLARTP